VSIYIALHTCIAYNFDGDRLTMDIEASSKDTNVEVGNALVTLSLAAATRLSIHT
jgi:hypothetical protein